MKKSHFLIPLLIFLVFNSFDKFEKKTDNFSKLTNIESIKYERFNPKNKEFKKLNDKFEKLLINKGQTKLILKLNKSKDEIVYWIFKEKVMNLNIYEKDTIKAKNLYAYIFEQNKDDLIEKVKFQDFGNEVYYPEFFYNYCRIDDANKDGFVEFYLTYFGESDGLDAKPLKVIIYTQDKLNAEYKKSKTTAFYPAGNENDHYYIDFDSNWKMLPESIKNKSKEILRIIKNKKIIETE